MKDMPIINKVAQSALRTLNLEEYYHKGERLIYDLKDNLFQGLVLREKNFRTFLKEHDWSTYEGKNVAILCSTDAIIPTWAYMLLTIKLEPYVNMVVCGDLKDLENALFKEVLSKLDVENFKDAKVIIKGCGDLPVPDFAYVEISRLLRPHVSSLMYGEPCSTVPVYKKAKVKT